MESLRLQIEASLGRSRDMMVEDHYRRMHFEGSRLPHPSPPHRIPTHHSPGHHRVALVQHHHPVTAIPAHQMTHVVNVPGNNTVNPSTAGGKLKKQLHMLAKRTIGKKQGSKSNKYPDEVSPIYYRHPRDKYGSVSALSTSAIYGELRPPPPSYAALYGGSTGVRQAGNRRGSAAALGGIHIAAPRRVGRVSVSPWETFLNIGEPIYEDVAQEMSSALSSPPADGSSSSTIPCTCPSPRAGGSLRVTSSSSLSSNGSISPRRKSILPDKIELYALTEERLDGEIKSPTSQTQKTNSPARRHTPKQQNNSANVTNNKVNVSNNKHSRNSEQSNKMNLGQRRITTPPGLNNVRKKMEANPFNSVASRKSILECDLTAYDMVKQYIRTAEVDSDVDEDDLSDNAVEELTAERNKLAAAKRWSEERKSAGLENDQGIGSLNNSSSGRHLQHSQGTRRMANVINNVPHSGVIAINANESLVTVPEPDYDDDEDDSDASYDLSRFKDLRISYSPPPARKPMVVAASPPAHPSNSSSSVSSLSSAYSSPPQSSSGSSHYQGSLYSSNSTYGTRTFSSSPSHRCGGVLSFNHGTSAPSIPPPLPPPMPTHSAGINRLSSTHSPTRPLAVPIPSVPPRVNISQSPPSADKGSLSPKRTLERPTIPPPPPPPPPLPVSSGLVASPYAVSDITPPPLPPRSPTTKITPQLSTFAPLPNIPPPPPTPVNPSLEVTPPIESTDTRLNDASAPVGLANLTVRSILKKTPSPSSGSNASKSSGGTVSKQVRFGLGRDDEALVIEHIEDNRWDSEEEVPAEDAILPEMESGGPSQVPGAAKTDAGVGEEFQSVESYLRGSGMLRSSWTIRNAAASQAASTVSDKTKVPNLATSATSASGTTSRSNEDSTGFEFKEFDPAAESTSTPTTTAQKNGLPSPAVPRPVDIESSKGFQSAENLLAELVVRHSDESAAIGQRGKDQSSPTSRDPNINSTFTQGGQPETTASQSVLRKYEESPEDQVLKLSASTFYIKIDENQSASTAKTETIEPEVKELNVDRTRSSSPDRRTEIETKEENFDKESSEIYAEVTMPDIEVMRVDLYDDARSCEPIYEELPDPDVVEEPKHKSLSDFIMSSDFSPCDGQPRSFFEGASRAEILHYLEDARERGIILSEEFITEINEMEEEAKREREENSRNNRISTLSHSSTGSSANSGNDDDIDDEDLEDSGHHHVANSEFILKPFTTVVTNGVVMEPVNKDKVVVSEKDNQAVTNGHSTSSAEVERADSGVGTETSKPSVRLRRFVAKKTPDQDGQDGAPGDELLCADCDQPVEPVEDELSGLLFCPLVCKKCDRRRAERKEIISEIVETELKYGRDLRIIREEFQRPMEVAGLLTKEQLKAIFLNLEELVRVNGQFAEKLHDAADIATDQGDEDYTTVNIGKLFVESTTMLHAFETYCVRQASASLLLTNLEKEKELLRIFLRVSQMENTLLRRMNLPAFLMVPVQRVTKYPLLLSRLHKVTPYHHHDREALREAQQKIELHLEHINQQTKGSGATRIWRRISNISSSSSNHRRLSNQLDDISSIKLRKMALEVLKWNRDEVRFVLAGRLLCATVVGSHRNSLQMGECGLSTSPAPDGSTSAGQNGTAPGQFAAEVRLQAVKKVKPLKLTPLHGLLVTLGKPNANYRPETADDEDGVFFPRNTGIRDATLLLIREKNGRLVQFRGPLHLGSCVISCWEGDKDSFEIQEFHTKEAYIFKCDDSKESKDWCHQLRYHAKDLGRWRRRRNALANIMINGMVRH